ncbi:MAG: potassium-transporting ATPase subunit KdpC [bacterium]
MPAAGKLLLLTIFTILLTGAIYPLLVWGFSQLLFPEKARGSMIYNGENICGSSLIGQSFTKPEYFHSRLSAAGSGYDALSSGGSNLGPTSKALISRVTDDVEKMRKEYNNLPAVPVDMVTASGSGLDPDITIANAYVQMPRVAKARGIDELKVRTLIEQQIILRQWGIFGEPRVNVLSLNRALDEGK